MIHPAFPPEATVAVNPSLGQTQETLARTAARLARVAGIRMTVPRGEFAACGAGRIIEADLAEAWAACTQPANPRPYRDEEGCSST